MVSKGRESTTIHSQTIKIICYAIRCKMCINIYIISLVFCGNAAYKLILKNYNISEDFQIKEKNCCYT